MDKEATDFTGEKPKASALKRIAFAGLASLFVGSAVFALSPDTIFDNIPGTRTLYEMAAQAGARMLTDLGVYKEESDPERPYLDDSLFPIDIEYDIGNVVKGYTKDDVYLVKRQGEWLLKLKKTNEAFAVFTLGGVYSIGNPAWFNGRFASSGRWPTLSFAKTPTLTADRLATTSEVAVVDAKIADTYGWARGVYNFLQGNTNAWFSGTNYPDRTGNNYKHKFALEDGMDIHTMPCSMALMERWEAKTLTVWDQRDWVSWYWNFKSAQFQARINETNAVIFGVIANLSSNMPVKAWSSYTARGLENPDPNTTFIDTKNVTLSAGFAWEKVATVSGAAYWTIVGDVAISSNESTGVFELKDFDGKSVIKITKGGTKLVYVDRAAMLAQGRDAQGRITFDMISDVQPLAECSTVPDTSTFVAETDAGCPAETAWTDLGGGKWRFHFILKDGIDAKSCFARFKVEVCEESRIEYGAAPVVTGGLMYNGVKFAPVIPSDANVGDTVTFKIISK